MARIVSIFQFIGRVGSAVGSKGKGGKVLLRQYQPSVTTFTGAEEGEVVAKCILLQPKTSDGINNIGQTAADSRGYVVDLNMSIHLRRLIRNSARFPRIG